MANYYFVGVLLPELQIGTPPEITFEEYKKLLHDNLHSQDYALTYVLRRYYDIENLRFFWKGAPLGPYGCLDETAMEEVLFYPELLPIYMRTFLEKHESKVERLKHFPELIAAYFREESTNATGFLKEYLLFERKLRLIQTAFRAKHLKRDLLEELQFEDPEEDFIQQLLALKDAKIFEPPPGFEELKLIFEENYASPINLYQALCAFRFNKVAQLIDNQIFTLDRLLGYMVQLILVEQWEALDQEKGNQLVDSYIKENA